MSSKNKMPEWYEIYPQGTQEGEEEKSFFISLARNKKYKNWRSASAISKETDIHQQRVEEIIFKYNKIGLVIQNPSNTEFWGYYHNNLDSIPEEKDSVIAEERKKLLNKKLNPAP